MVLNTLKLLVTYHSTGYFKEDYAEVSEIYSRIYEITDLKSFEHRKMITILRIVYEMMCPNTTKLTKN